MGNDSPQANRARCHEGDTLFIWHRLTHLINEVAEAEHSTIYTCLCAKNLTYITDNRTSHVLCWQRDMLEEAKKG